MTDPKYRGEHLKLRAQWKQRIVNGEHPPCARCNIPLNPEDASTFHLDHDDEGINYLGPSHGQCNTSAAGKKAQRLAKARRQGPRRPRSQMW